jgi:hypothetical protein
MMSQLGGELMLFILHFLTMLLLVDSRIVKLSDVLADTIEKCLINLHTVLLALLNMINIVRFLLELIVHSSNNYPVYSLYTECGVYHNQIQETQQYATRQRPDHVPEIVVLRVSRAEGVKVHYSEAA